MKKRCIRLYHFYHPDDVISAQLFTELAEYFVANGMEPEVWTSNRYCHEALNTKTITPSKEILNCDNWKGDCILTIIYEKTPFVNSF